tara:strand:- start:1392 stop:1778 length:387 start_codon:yes stop_codon:yes gene_type:complete
MLLKGYGLSLVNCSKTFLLKYKQKEYDNKHISYIVKLNDKIKIGSCNNLYNRIGTYNSMYKNVSLLSARQFPTDITGQIKYHTIHANALAKINKGFFHDSANEITIMKSVKDLSQNKFSILQQDLLRV